MGLSNLEIAERTSCPSTRSSPTSAPATARSTWTAGRRPCSGGSPTGCAPTGCGSPARRPRTTPGSDRVGPSANLRIARDVGAAVPSPGDRARPLHHHRRHRPRRPGDDAAGAAASSTTCPATTPTTWRSSGPRRTCTRRSRPSGEAAQARRRAGPRPGDHRADRHRVADAHRRRDRRHPAGLHPPGAFAGELINPRGCYICKNDYTLVDAFYHWLCPTCAAIATPSATSAPT